MTWVNIDANAKLGALKAKTIDATTSFFNLHHVFARELGSDMGFLAWKDAGVNPYGNSIIANGAWLKANRDKAAKFVKVTQKAFADCAKTPEPCIKALVEANGALLYDNELINWHLVTILMSDDTSRTVALGWHDDKRMADDYKLVDEYLKMEKPYDIKTAYTNEFLDKTIKMPPINPPKLYLIVARAASTGGPRVEAGQTRRAPHPNSGPTTAKVRAASSKRVDRPVDHAGQRAHRAEAARREQAAHVRLGVGEIDEQRAVDRSERPRQQRAWRSASSSAISGPSCAAMRPSRPSRKPAMRPSRSAISSAAGRRPRRPASTPLRSAPKAAAS